MRKQVLSPHYPFTCSFYCTTKSAMNYCPKMKLHNSLFPFIQTSSTTKSPMNYGLNKPLLKSLLLFTNALWDKTRSF